MACGGSKGRVLETQGFPVLSSGDPLRQVVWPSFLFVGHPSKEPDSGLRPELAWGSQHIRYWLLILLCWENT